MQHLFSVLTSHHLAAFHLSVHGLERSGLLTDTEEGYRIKELSHGVSRHRINRYDIKDDTCNSDRCQSFSYSVRSKSSYSPRFFMDLDQDYLSFLVFQLWSHARLNEEYQASRPEYPSTTPEERANSPLRGLGLRSILRGARRNGDGDDEDGDLRNACVTLPKEADANEDGEEEEEKVPNLNLTSALALLVVGTAVCGTTLSLGSRDC